MTEYNIAELFQGGCCWSGCSAEYLMHHLGTSSHFAQIDTLLPLCLTFPSAEMNGPIYIMLLLGKPRQGLHHCGKNRQC